MSTKVYGQASLVGRLFFVHYGNLYSWNLGETEATRHTTDGYYANLMLSPDGTRLAFRSLLLEGWSSSYYDASNLWLWDLQTDTMTQLTTNIEADPDLEGYISRSAPTWSPDNNQLAWTEWDSQGIDIMTYDVETGETQQHSTDVSFGFSDAGEYQAQEVFWGRYITKAVFTFFEDTTAGTVLSIYDDAGQRCAYQLDRYQRTDSVSDEIIPQLDQWQWVQYDGAWWIGLQYEGLRYRLMNPDTGEQFEVDQFPTLQLMDDDANAEAIRQREALEANMTDAPEYFESAVSADGQYLAIQTFNSDEGQVAIWHDGEVIITLTTPKLDNLDIYTSATLAWSWSTWQLPDDSQITPVTPILDSRSGDCGE